MSDLKQYGGRILLLRNYLGTIDNPELVVYRIEPRQVRYMREWALEYHDVAFD